MRRHIILLLVFIILTFILTYPLTLHMHEAVQEPGDSLFITWTIFWDIKALLRDPLNIFHANIFYPYRYTLAYSEHLIGVGLLALPIYIFTKNPLFIYNSMLLLSFILCGWCAYLLTYHLTKDRLAGIVSGIIFAFCPFRFDQFEHLHVLTCQWIPIVLLFLHKMCPSPLPSPRLWRGEGWVRGLGFGFFFFLQFISSGHNGLYLALAVGLFMLYFRIFPWRALLIVGILILPFYYPYIYLAREFGFERQACEFKIFSPQLDSYLGVPSGNWLYGKYLSGFWKPETAVVFPGAAALLLSIWRKAPWRRFRVKINLINILIIIDLIVIITLIFTGGVDTGKSFFGIKLKVTEFTRPVLILLLLFALKRWEANPVKFYWILAITAFLLSFGPMIRSTDKDIIWGPYSLLYKYVPGFKGLRVSGRIYTLFILAIAVLAGFGVKKIRERTKRMYYISWIIPFIILVEYINVPIRLLCWIGDKPSPAYRWLANQPGDSAMVELPMPYWYNMFWHEIQYQYWSLFHGKKLINGYSGYSPPAYWPIAEKMQNFPNEDAIEILRYLDVKYILVHEGKIIENTGDYKLKFRDGDDYIYAMSKAGPCSSSDEQGPALLIAGISSNYNSKDIYKAIDNNPTTRWHSDTAQKPGMFVELDLGKIQEVCGVSMYFGASPMDYPRGIELEISVDRTQWHRISLKHIYANYVKHLLKYPKDSRMVLNFEPEEVRYIRITQTGSHDVFFWSIYELEVYSL